MGLFDHFPYTNVHELNLDWVLSMMKTLEAEWEAFTAGNSLQFADPMLHDISKTYAKNTIVLDSNGNAYVSLQAVPVGVGLQNGNYWLMVFDYEAFIEKVNKNFTARYYIGSYRATAAMAIGDWLTVDDVLYKATAAIAVDDILEDGVNITHFTLEDFIKAFMQSANQLIQQYKNDIDASELLYRQQLAGDIAQTTASLQAQLDAVIAGATVDSEVIDARVGADAITYATLGSAIRTQMENLNKDLERVTYASNAWSPYFSYKMYPGMRYKITNIGTAGQSLSFGALDADNNNVPFGGFIECNPGESCYITVDREATQVRLYNYQGAVTELVPDIKSLGDVVDEVDHLYDTLILASSTNGWTSYKTHYFYPDLTYECTNLSTDPTSTVLDINAQNAYIGVGKTGFTTLNSGDSCNITFDAYATGVRAYLQNDAALRIRCKLPSLASFYEVILDIYKTVDPYRERISMTASGWSSYYDIQLSPDQEYEVYVKEVGSGGLIAMQIQNSDGRVVNHEITSGSIPASNGDIFRFQPCEYASRIRAYFTGKIEVYNVSTTAGNINENFSIQDGYGFKDAIKERVTVRPDGTGDYQYISAAVAACNHGCKNHQYEIAVYPGVYEEINIIVPPFTHIHGLAPNSVIVTSRAADPASTDPVFDQRYSSSKLSDMTIESHNGYCIHYDVSLDEATLVNENLILHRTVPAAGAAIIGGGSFYNGAKYIWRNCIFKADYAQGAACHTNANKECENTHITFENCVFINSWLRNGNVGGFGYCVYEIKGCTFEKGFPGLVNWTSDLRTTPDPNLYLFDRNEWQIIGGRNKNLLFQQTASGKTIRFTADHPIVVSGNAAEVIFGYNPTYNNIKTPRLDCSVTSMYYIDDSQAGTPPSVDVYQLWKRLGDCTGTPLNLVVTVDGVTCTYNFTQNYLVTQPTEASLIADMQLALTNVTISAITASGFNYDDINTSDMIYVKVASDDILKYEFITYDGYKADNTTPAHKIAGVCVKDTPQGEYAKVYTDCYFDQIARADGLYGLNSNGVLDASATTKVVEIFNSVAYIL